jgi:uncharacterized protein YjaG (DUF416 family)
MSKREKLQNVWHRYDNEREHKPSGTREVVEWAVEEGLLELPEVDPYDVLAGQMAQALRDELGTDAKGRRYRLNHAVRITKVGVQHTFWAMMGFASRDHMEKTFAQRREQIIGDCYHLKIDVDVYNDMNPNEKHEVQLVLDFTEDVAEREELENPGDRAA